MKLLTNELRKVLPPLYSMENKKDPMIICKFFLPSTKWSWFAIEFDEEDTFFGYVAGQFPELGYFSLSELEKVDGPFGVGVERDLYFEPQRLSGIKKQLEQLNYY